MFKLIANVEFIGRETYTFKSAVELVKFLKWVAKRQNTKRRAAAILNILAIEEIA